jgi:excisionase family DNA binding protein
MSDHEQWVTTREAASYLKINVRTLRHLVRLGRIKGHVILGTKRKGWRFRLRELDGSMAHL